eukprot:TRINITY_DN11119_c0_g1_i1.p2 TRINITY_DN11119_c0_g1~~TRINITY_DN11119_c0_g1_i1.p2  ORF type:complete len:574 (+),score=100.38 TRINITY_DN11119_c0_g1_i1:70-1722(+)
MSMLCADYGTPIMRTHEKPRSHKRRVRPGALTVSPPIDVTAPMISVSPPNRPARSPTSTYSMESGSLHRTGSCLSLGSSQGRMYPLSPRSPRSPRSPTLSPCSSTLGLDDGASVCSNEVPPRGGWKRTLSLDCSGMFLTADPVSLPNTPPSRPWSPVQPPVSPTNSCFSQADDADRNSYSKCSSPYPERVSTPWIRNVSLHDGVTLGEEVIAFGVFLAPTVDELAMRNNLRRILQQAVATICVHSTVKFIGSCGVGIALPTSGIDMVVEGWSVEGRDGLQYIVQCLNDAGHPASITDDGRGIAHNRNGRIVFEADVSSERRLVHNLKRRMDTMDGASRAVALVVRIILSQSNLDGAIRGGLSGTVVALMVAKQAQTLPKHDTAAEFASALLNKTLETYGKWDWTEHAINMDNNNKEGNVKKRPFAVSPYSGVNLAADCVKERQISAMMVYTSMAIGKWAAPSVTDLEKNTRGVTPLSSVVAHKDLWVRSQAIRQASSTPAVLSLKPPSPGLPNSSYLPASFYEPVSPLTPLSSASFDGLSESPDTPSSRK